MRSPLMLALVTAGMLAGHLPSPPVAAAELTATQADATGRPITPAVATILHAVATLDRALAQISPEEAKAERTPQQAAKTLDRYQRAAAAGLMYAQYNLAEALLDRRGIAPDVNKAIALLRQIAEGGYQPAQMRLAEEHLRGEGQNTSRAEAYAWYSIAAHDGSKAAERAQGLLGPLLTPAAREAADRLSRSLDATVTESRLHRPLPAQQKALDEALAAALDSENAAKTDQLLAQGADPNATDRLGRSAVIDAAWRGRARMVALLLDRGVDADLRDNEGHTALAWAAINGFSDIVQSLLAAGGMTDVPDAEGLTPLMRAAWNGHPEIVQALLAAGAAPDRKDFAGKSALDRALSQDDKVIAAMLREAAAKR